MNWQRAGLQIAAVLTVACSGEAPPTDESSDPKDGTFLVDGKADAFGVAEGSPLAVGVLRLVNTAPEALLDDEVALDGRASRAIVAHRDGADAQLGTADDDPIDTLTELDAIAWVGSSAFGRLVSYARDNGYVDYATGNPEQVLPGPTEARAAFASEVLDDGRLLIVGGRNDSGTLASGEVYDSGTQTWSPIAPMNRTRLSPTATLLDDGRVLVAGGLAPGSEYGLNSAEIWDPTTDTWTDGGTFDGGRYDHTATKLNDGRVVLIGGKSSARAYTHIDVSVYAPSTNTWTKTGVTPVGVDGHTATLAPDGSILIIGGYNRFNKYRTRAVMQFDPATNEVDVITHLNTGRDNHAAVLIGGELWVIGGESDDDYIATGEAIDLQTHEVRPLPPLVKARSGHSATLMPNGDLVVLGGKDENGWRGITDVDIWEPTATEWRVGTPLQTARVGNATFDTPSGIMLVGGSTDGSDNPASSLYLASATTAVVQPPTETVTDWALIPHFGERFKCAGEQLVYHEAMGQLICFKGREAENEPTGTYGWTPNGWVEILDETQSPVPPRTMHAMTYDSARGKIVLFGGQKRYGFDLDDVWEFDGTSWTEVQPADVVVPPRQRMGELVYDSTRGRSVLLPGYMDGTLVNDLFAWDGTRWTVVPQGNNGAHFGSDAYDARRGYDAVYDPTRDRIVMYGGWANSHPTPTLEFDGQNWQQGGSGGPSTYGSLDGAFDPATGTIVAAGIVRSGNSQQARVWRYDGTWQEIVTEYRFDYYQFDQGVTFDANLGIVIGGGSLRQLLDRTKPNHRPTIGYLGQRTIYPNEPFAVSLETSDPDGHVLTLTASSLPDGAVFDATTGALQWTPRPDQGGEYTITFRASDGALSRSQDLNIKVEGLIAYPMLPTGTIDMSGGATMTGTVRERRRNGYEHRNGSFRVTCDFTGANPGRVTYVCHVVNTSRWPYDYNVVASGQLRPDGKLGTYSSAVSGYVEALQWDDYELHLTGFDVSWQQGQELWSASGDYAGYLTAN